jgi:hypothetical protein
LTFLVLLPLQAPAVAPKAAAGNDYLQIFVQQFTLNAPTIPAEILKRLTAPPTKKASDSHGALWRATAQGLLEKTPAGKKQLWTGKDGLPILSLSVVAAGPGERLWLGSSEGAICFQRRAHAQDRWSYFWGRRYLGDNQILNIVPDAEGAWIRTRTGISRLEFEPYDLGQKSEFFLGRLQQRHNRYGYVADCDLVRPGDVSSFRLAPSDNDGLWTAIYVAAECFRYALTRSPEALRNARVSLAALRRLESITGIPGFPARALIRRGDYRAPDGEWHWTPDGEWEWKGDTSSDELVGHFFAYAVAYDLLPDESDRAAVRSVAARIAHHLLEHALNLVGPGGRITRWGRYSPEYFRTPDGKADCALNSLEILSHLRVAYHLTHDEEFLRAYRHLIDDWGYLRNVDRFATEGPAEVNYSDEELAYLAFYPLMKVEDDQALLARYRRALRGLWLRTRDEKNPLWNFIYAAGTGAQDFDRQDALETLERIPLDTISWTVRNSQRADIMLRPRRGRFGERESLRALPPNERAMMKWNGNPFQLDGGNGGRSEDDGAFFLLPYWLGRFHKLLGR